MAAYCSGKAGAWPDNPWDHDHPVFKVGPGERGKIFAFLGSAGVGVKAARTREVADEWLHRYPGSASVMAYIGRSGWMNFAVLISCPSFLAAMLSRIARAIASSPTWPRSIALTSVSSRLNRQFRNLPSAVMRKRSQLMQKGRLTDAMIPMRPIPSSN